MASSAAELRASLDRSIAIRKRIQAELRVVAVIVGLILLALAGFVYLQTAANAAHTQGERRERRGLEAVVVGLRAVVAAQAQTLVRVKRQAATNCEANREVARVDRLSLIQTQRTNRAILPKANIPGLTHEQLVTLTRQQERRDNARIAKLRQIAERVCAGRKVALGTTGPAPIPPPRRSSGARGSAPFQRHRTR